MSKFKIPYIANAGFSTGDRWVAPAYAEKGGVLQTRCIKEGEYRLKHFSLTINTRATPQSILIHFVGCLFCFNKKNKYIAHSQGSFWLTTWGRKDRCILLTTYARELVGCNNHN
jgi:hypothetical protein